MCKSAVSDLGANKAPAAFEQAGKCLGVLDKLSTEFDKSLGVSEVYGTQSLPNDAIDMRMILKELIASDVFTKKQSREYHSTSLYTGIEVNPISKTEQKSMIKWIIKHLTSLKN